MFDTSLQDHFQMFGTSHLISGLIILISAFFVYYYREELREKKRYDFFRYLFVIVTIGQEVSLNIYRVILGEWEISTSLPLQLCGLAMIITSFILITGSKKAFNSTFLILLLGAALAILTPAVDKNYGFPHYRFFQFFLGHGMIVVNITFMLFVMGFINDIKYKYLFNNFVALMIFGSFNLFGEHPWYLLNIFLFGIPIFFHILYLPFFIRNRLVDKKELRTE